MNHGTRHAHGTMLYFLRADSWPPPGFGHDLQRAVARGYGSGYFQLAFDSSHWLLRFSAWCTRLPLTVVRFGDQNLFVRRELFERIGVFRQKFLVMEDQEIIHRPWAQRPFFVVPKAVLTSARKYRANGAIRLQSIFTSIAFLYWLGVPQRHLVRIYQRFIRQSPSPISWLSYGPIYDEMNGTIPYFECFSTILNAHDQRERPARWNPATTCAAIIIFLDEPTASLDPIKQGRTVAIISHSLAQIVDSDCIYVMKKGHRVESGTYHECDDMKGTDINRELDITQLTIGADSAFKKLYLKDLQGPKRGQDSARGQHCRRAARPAASHVPRHQSHRKLLRRVYSGGK